jgi:hypothetical protein
MLLPLLRIYLCASAASSFAVPWSAPSCPRVSLSLSSTAVAHRRGCLGLYERVGKDRFKLSKKYYPQWCCCCGACDDKAEIFLSQAGRYWTISQIPQHAPFLLKYTSHWQVLGGLGSTDYHTAEVNARCLLPTQAPTPAPTANPTTASPAPTATPTEEPSSVPTLVPTQTPTRQPTRQPTRPFGVCAYIMLTLLSAAPAAAVPRTLVGTRLGANSLRANGVTSTNQKQNSSSAYPHTRAPIRREQLLQLQLQRHLGE